MGGCTRLNRCPRDAPTSGGRPDPRRRSDMANATSTDGLEHAHAQLVAAVEALTSGEDWQRMLDVAARFHHYSPGNCLLILAQRPNATRVAGYRTWQSLGRQV